MWAPQPGPQADAISARWCPELFFGGARGGGKSDFLLGDFLQDVGQGVAWQGIIIRRTYPELQQLIRRSLAMYQGTGGEWHEQAKEWRWSNGACLRFRYLESVKDASRYQGHEYTWIGWDEITQWPTLEAYNMLMACLRSPLAVDCKRVRSSGNPGGAGHLAVKQYFIDPAPGGYRSLDNGRMFIPSKVTDNKILLKNDPEYIQRLERSGSSELVRMWLAGDWNVIAGAYFSEFGQHHVVEPYALPRHWLRFRAFDWGHAEPFCCLWGALSDGVELSSTGKHLASSVSKGAIVVYREWYGWDGRPNVGMRAQNEAIARGIIEREKEEKIAFGVADPSIFKEEGGPSIAEVIRAAGCSFDRADNERVAGWSQIHGRLKAERLQIFNTCTHLIRTLPALQHDDKKPEDVADGYEDHAPDALRYLCMARPWTQTPKEPGPIKLRENLTFNEFMALHKPRAQVTGF